MCKGMEVRNSMLGSLLGIYQMYALCVGVTGDESQAGPQWNNNDVEG